MSGILENLRGSASKSVLRQLSVGYLALVAGCASTAETVVKTDTHGQDKPAPSALHVSAKSGTDGKANPYNLPELGSPESKQSNETHEAGIDPVLGAPGMNQLLDSQDPHARLTRGEQDMNGLLAGLASAATSKAVKDWFQTYHANAQLNVGVGEGGVKTGSFDLLMPLIDDQKNNLVYTQIGIRRSNEFTEDYRTTLNLGLGYRHQLDQWLLGVNTFYDRDMTGKNERIGFGLEAWTDNLKLSANSYIRLSDWKKSPDLDDYLERPANGWDLRAEAFLPSYPQLSGKIMFEQYYGDEVSLFGGSDFQKDPSAATVGLSYTPIPLVSVSTDYRQGQNGLSETSMRIGLNYRLGQPLAQQLSPDQVRATHLLSNARYDLVNRRNEIVLDHKRVAHGTIALPNNVVGSSGATVSFPVKLSGASMSQFTWKGTAASYTQAYGGGPTGSLQLPANASGLVQSYTLQILAIDATGELVQSNVMTVNVTPVEISLAASKASGVSDGTDAIEFTATLTQQGGEPLANTAVNWSVQGQATVASQDNTTNAQGVAKLRVVSRFATNVHVSVSQGDAGDAQADAVFVSDVVHGAVTEVAASPSVIYSDSQSASTLTATVKDSNGQPAVGVSVDWTSNLGLLSASTSTTDENGLATVKLTSGVVGLATVAASSELGSAQAQVTVKYYDHSHIDPLVVDSTQIPADGTTQAVFTATVLDQNNQPVPAGIPVTWSASGGQLGGASTVTDSNGKSSVVMTSTTPGTATVTAAVSAGSASQSVQVVAASQASYMTLDVSRYTMQVYFQVSTLTATVYDENGNPLANQNVAWDVASNLSTLDQTVVTDENGQVHLSVIGTEIGGAYVSATTDNDVSQYVFLSVIDSGTIVN